MQPASPLAALLMTCWRSIAIDDKGRMLELHTTVLAVDRRLVAHAVVTLLGLLSGFTPLLRVMDSGIGDPYASRLLRPCRRVEELSPEPVDRLAARDGAVRLKLVLAEDVRYAPRSSARAEIFQARARFGRTAWGSY
jgi:hypothetical protein